MNNVHQPKDKAVGYTYLCGMDDVTNDHLRFFKNETMSTLGNTELV